MVLKGVTHLAGVARIYQHGIGIRGEA